MLGWLDKSLNREAWRPPARKAAGVLALVVLLGFWGGLAAVLQWVLQGSWPGWLLLVASCGQRCWPSAASTSTSAPSPTALEKRPRERSQAVSHDRRPRHRGARRGRRVAAPPSRAWPRISPTASSRRSSGWRCGGLPGARRLQGGQHRRQHDRPPDAAVPAFGWAAARLDDLVNLPASRLSALLDRARRRCAARRFAATAALARRAARRRRSTARPMPAGRRRRWPARSASRSPARASMAASWSTILDGRRAARGDARRTSAGAARSTALPA